MSISPPEPNQAFSAAVFIRSPVALVATAGVLLIAVWIALWAVISSSKQTASADAEQRTVSAVSAVAHSLDNLTTVRGLQTALLQAQLDKGELAIPVELAQTVLTQSKGLGFEAVIVDDAGTAPDSLAQYDVTYQSPWARSLALQAGRFKDAPTGTPFFLPGEGLAPLLVYATPVMAKGARMFLVSAHAVPDLLASTGLPQLSANYALTLSNNDTQLLRYTVPSTPAHDVDLEGSPAPRASAEAVLTAPAGPLSLRLDVFETQVTGGPAARNSVLVELCLWFSCLVASGTILGAIVLKDMRRTEHRLRWQVSRDALTELPNRRALTEMLEELFSAPSAQATEVGLLFLDLDNFKPVNDTYGHKTGDLLLRAVAHRLTVTLKGVGTVCRLGGDEFAVLGHPGLPREKLQAAAQAAVDAMKEPFVLEGIPVHTGTSVGLAYSTGCRSSSDLLKNADMAMYNAKKAGKGLVREFGTEMAKKEVEQELLTIAMHPGLKGEQFRLMYQPNLDLRTGKVVGYEALLRWDHPEFGSIGPSQFIGLAEVSGFIHELGTWLLHTVLRQMVAWNAEGEGHIPVAINLSPVQLLDPYFVGRIKRMLDAYEVPPSCLRLELSGLAITSNVKHINRVFKSLRDMGVKIAIDDFGTGVSSLTALQQFEVDFLKIDTAFIGELGSDVGDKVCRSIINLAHSLDVAVVAEGVETPSQLKLLVNKQCDEAQGYLISEPLLPADVPSFKLAHEVLSLLPKNV